ncbi:MAG: hypothetical protein GEV12_03530 [Micromonosporaceae bacterium]|nr:hypothetical protein [Micromonosporaceae bacterium]
MTTTMVEQTRTAAPGADLRADLQAAHLAATAVVAGLDLDHRQLWRRADRTVAELAAAGDRLTAAITGEQPGSTARSVPPVVRVRTLVAAQQRLFAALDRHPALDPELLAQATREVRTATAALSSFRRAMPDLYPPQVQDRRGVSRC